MLANLHINNFTLVDNLDIEFHAGFTALTGETGAGKSILLDALAMVLGARSDADKVRAGKDKAEIAAEFDLSNTPEAKSWLERNDLHSDDECILRRVVTKEGRSRAYINGKSATLGQIRELGEILVNIHGQHEHQSLLKASNHSRILDNFSNSQTLVKEVKEKFKNWRKIKEQLDDVKTLGDENDARFQLLSYQVNELNQLDLQEGELAQLEQEQRALSTVEQSLFNVQQTLTLINSEESGVHEQLSSGIQLISDIQGNSAALDNAFTLLQSAMISLEESRSDLDYFLSTSETDPEKLGEIELRLNQIYQVAAKHKVKPQEIPRLHQKLAEELSNLAPNDQTIAELTLSLKKASDDYFAVAKKLSSKRKSAATKLTKLVNKKLSQLALSHAKFEVSLAPEAPEAPSKTGLECIEFLIATQPGQMAKPIIKIASGGELSRISLAIQVVIGETSATPTLVFDEVDAGIGGTTGDVVGKMLQEIGEQNQVFCVTHLAQVASKSDSHFLVEKTLSRSGAASSLKALTANERISEIARMMGGAIDSKQSLAHAREMLEAA